MTLPLKPHAVTNEEQVAFVDRMLDEMRITGEARSQQRATLLSMPVPSQHPAFRDLRITPNDTMWINEAWPEDGATEGRRGPSRLTGSSGGSAVEAFHAPARRGRRLRPRGV